MSKGEDTTWGKKDWIKKLKQQAKDSKEYRHKLYEKVDLKSKKNILDVGCGPGQITLDIANITNGQVTGIDIDPEKLEKAKILLAETPNVKLLEADAQDLPFAAETFDLVIFTITLIYIQDQQKAINEMVRVTKPGGIVFASLEPDYAGEINYPESPVKPLILKQMQELGADLETGRKLKVLFNKAGLKTEVGMETETDYIMIKDDQRFFELYNVNSWVTEKLLRKDNWPEEKIRDYIKTEGELIKKGMKFHLLPCFYAIGRKI
jgi:ubiquinone/menaquinone biosynthesis C-methylase UbiE